MLQQQAVAHSEALGQVLELAVDQPQAEALKQAQKTLKEEGKDIMTEGLVLASDGFFPFNDCVAIAAEYGIKAIVQPGGSIRDEDSIKLANEKGITMLFTGERHFKH